MEVFYFLLVKLIFFYFIVWILYVANRANTFKCQKSLNKII